MSLSTLKQPTSSNRLTQKQLFYLLHDFAFRLSARYSAFEEEPNRLMYEAFARLFRYLPKEVQANRAFLETRLRDLVISICVEVHNQKQEELQLTVSIPAVPGSSQNIRSSKDVIDLLRRLPFIQRAIYNMVVIDGLDARTIAQALGLPIHSVDHHLQLAREQLKYLLEQTEVRQRAQGYGGII